MKSKIVPLCISLLIVLLTIFAPFGYLNYRTPLYIHDVLSNRVMIAYGILCFHTILSSSIRMFSFERTKLLFLFDSFLLIVFYAAVIMSSKEVLVEIKEYDWRYEYDPLGVNYVFFISLFLLLSLEVFFNIKWIASKEK